MPDNHDNGTSTPPPVKPKFMLLQKTLGAIPSIFTNLRRFNERIAGKGRISAQRVLQVEVGGLLVVGATMIQLEEYAIAVACWVFLAIIWASKATSWKGVDGRPRITGWLKAGHVLLVIVACVLMIMWTNIKRDNKEWSGFQKLWKHKAEQPKIAYVPTPTPTPSATPTPLEKNIKDQLSLFVLEGQQTKDQFAFRLCATGVSDEVIGKYMSDVADWDHRVKLYLEKPQLGLPYLARFVHQVSPHWSYPCKFAKSTYYGVWNLLISDLEKLDEFIRELTSNNGAIPTATPTPTPHRTPMPTPTPTQTPTPPPTPSPTATPASIAPARLVLSLYTLDSKAVPIREITLPEIDGVVTIDFFAGNKGESVATNGELVIFICNDCTLAKEPEGSVKVRGAHESQRNFPFQRIYPDTFMPKMTLQIKVPSKYAWLEISGDFYCDLCAKSTPQILRVYVKRN